MDFALCSGERSEGRLRLLAAFDSYARTRAFSAWVQMESRHWGTH